MPATAPAARATPQGIGHNAATQVAAQLNALLADAFALYMKSKNFHWHVSGPHFRDYHLLFDEQATQILGMTDLVAERVRKLGCRTHSSLGSLVAARSIADNDATDVTPGAMLVELMGDNRALADRLRETKALCDEARDYATSALVDTWIDEAEQRAWFLLEAARGEPEMAEAAASARARSAKGGKEKKPKK